MKQAFGACPTHEQRAAYLSLSAQAMHLLNSAGRLSILASCVPVSHCNQNFSSRLLNAFSAPFSRSPYSLSHFLICWSQLEASQVGLGQ